MSRGSNTQGTGGAGTGSGSGGSGSGSSGGAGTGSGRTKAAHRTIPAQLAASMLLDRPDDCWPFIGSRLPTGPGSLWHPAAKRTVLAHRLAYELFVGPIPAGLMLDHLCHEPASCAGGVTCPHRACVNTAHMRPATNRENTLRGCGPTALNALKRECPQGHLYDKRNTAYTTEGYRKCRACKAERDRVRGLRRPNR